MFDKVSSRIRIKFHLIIALMRLLLNPRWTNEWMKDRERQIMSECENEIDRERKRAPTNLNHIHGFCSFSFTFYYSHFQFRFVLPILLSFALIFTTAIIIIINLNDIFVACSIEMHAKQCVCASLKVHWSFSSVMIAMVQEPLRSKTKIYMSLAFSSIVRVFECNTL